MPESDEDDDGAVPPLPPEDRLWRHPSELAALAGPPPEPDPPPPPRRRRALVGVGVLSGLAGAAATVVTLAALGAFAPAATDVASTSPAPDPTTTTLATAGAVASAVAPAVVEVIAELEDGTRRGSGVVVRSDGLVLTSGQLVAGAASVRVRWPSGRDAAATLEGDDDLTGLAALTVAGTGYTTATLDITTPEVGEPTITVSARTGGASPQVIEGVVAATSSHVETDDAQLVGLIETDEPVPADADGGALVDAEGNLRGVCLAVGDEAGWAVPAEVAMRVADDLRRLGRVDRGWLGIGGTPIESDGTVPAGFAIAEVSTGSPADGAGLEVGDVVIAVDDHRVRSLGDVRAALTLTRPGQEVVVEVARPDASPVSLPVTLGTLQG